MEAPNTVNDEKNILLETALSKLNECAGRFARERDAVELTTFECRDLDKERFREQLRRGLGCKLSMQEVEALMPILDKQKNGTIDGTEFILLFYKIRFEVRNKALSEHLIANRKPHILVAEKDRGKNEEADSASKAIMSFDFTADDQVTALQKLAGAAATHDRLMPGSSQLSAFDSEYLTPVQFKEQLTRNFNLKLNSRELVSLIRYFNKSDLNGNVNCSDFLVWFIRTAFEEKSKVAQQRNAARLKLIEEQKQKLKQEQELTLQHHAQKVEVNYKPEEKESALKKIAKAAELYDKNSPVSLNLIAFEIAYMPPHEFGEQLKRLFNMKLSAGELGALLDHFTVNEQGELDCVEFLKSFLMLGVKERERVAREVKERQMRVEEKRKEAQINAEREISESQALKLSYNFTEAEFKSAIEKLTDAAWRYDRTKYSSMGLEAFEAKTMPPHIFKEQLKRVFNIPLSPPELGALMSYFDKEGVGYINCAEFLIQFFRTGFEERSRREQIWRKYDEDKMKVRKEQRKTQEQAAEQKNALKVQYAFSEEDFRLAIAKLTEAATKYDKKSPGAVGLDAFQCESMPPHVFKEQLKRVFNIPLSPPELGALMSYFDKEGVGYINCAEFLIQFFRTGFEERSRVRSAWIEYRVKKERADREEEQRRLQENLKRAQAQVNFDFTEEEFDSATSKLVETIRGFDRRQLGPAGMRAFDMDALTPTEFKETLKKTFNLKLTPAELGALVTLFDPKACGLVSCPSFLNAFAHMKVKLEQAFSGKAEEMEVVKEYLADMKATYKARVLEHVSGQTGDKLRPWRSDNSGRHRGTKAKLKPKAEFPKTARARLRRRLTVARNTGILDLSTLLTFAVAQDGDGEAARSLSIQSKDALVEAVHSVHSDRVSANVTPPGMASFVTAVEESEVSPATRGRGGTRSSTASLATHELDGAEIHDPAVATSKPSRPLIHEDNTLFVCREIPATAFQMSGLRELWLCHNRIAGLPSQISSLVNLEVLSLKGNLLTSIPPEVGHLPCLKRLYLQRNKLSALPDSIAKLSQLMDLSLADNLYQALPMEVYSCTALAILDVSRNKISSLPFRCLELRSLIMFNLEGNPIETAPEVLGIMHWTFVSGCPLLPRTTLAATTFQLSRSEEVQLEGFLRHRALARKKSKSQALISKKKAAGTGPGSGM